LTLVLQVVVQRGFRTDVKQWIVGGEAQLEA